MTSKRILISGARAPVALHMARVLSTAGHEVHLVDSLNHPVSSKTKFVHKYHKIPRIRYEYAASKFALQDILEQHSIDMVIPTCEEIFYLAQMWEESSFSAKLFAPSFGLLARVHNKFSFIELCETLGLKAPATHLLSNHEDVSGVAKKARDFVFKPVWSRFAKNLLLRPNAKQLKRISPSAAFPWVAQAFISGNEMCAYAIAHAGKLSACSIYKGLVRAGPAASVCFEPIENQQAHDFVERFVAGTRWTGQVSFDLIQNADGEILPIECNPRATSGLHFFKEAAPFSAALLHGTAKAVPDEHRPQGIRLAMWLYGWPKLLTTKERRRFWATTRHTRDVFDWPGDKITMGAQLRSVMEFCGLAIRNRTSLHKAATHDMEWDGPDQSSI